MSASPPCLNVSLRSLSLFSKHILFIYGCAGSPLLHGLFSSCGEQGLLSSYGERASHCSDFSCGAEALGHVGTVVAAPRL